MYYATLKDLIKQRKASAVSGAAKQKIAQFEKKAGSMQKRPGSARENFGLIPSTFMGWVVAILIIAVLIKLAQDKKYIPVIIPGI